MQSNAEDPNNLADQNKDTESAKTIKITKMLLTVVGSFYLCWLPFIVITLILVNPPPAWRTTIPPIYVNVLQEISKGLLFLSSALNPMIYAWKSTNYKIAFKRILGWKDNSVGSFI